MLQQSTAKLNGHSVSLASLSRRSAKAAAGESAPTTRTEAVERFRQLPKEWHDPETWNREPFSHTITVTTYRGFGLCTGNTLLLQQLAEREMLRGGPQEIWPLYVFCEKALDGGPTAAVFGRAPEYECDANGYTAMLKTCDRGYRKVSTKTHPLVYRVVGMVAPRGTMPWHCGPNAAFRVFPRSEVPLPAPCKVTGDLLRNGVDGVNTEKCNLSHVSALLMQLGDEIGTPGANYDDMQCQDLGNRVEYLAGQLDRHIADLTKSVETIDEGRARLHRGE